MKKLEPIWYDEESKQEEPRLRSVEEQVEFRISRNMKRLMDCDLPDGFVLLTPEPRQFWMSHTIAWGFMLAFGEYRHVSRYDSQVRDEVQMQWALDDFYRDLKAAGIDPGKRLRAPIPIERKRRPPQAA